MKMHLGYRDKKKNDSKDIMIHQEILYKWQNICLTCMFWEFLTYESPNTI